MLAESLVSCNAVAECSRRQVGHIRPQLSALSYAGAEWIDQEVVVDDNLNTRRKPDDIPAFNRELINTFGRFHRRRDDARRQAVPMDVHDR